MKIFNKVINLLKYRVFSYDEIIIYVLHKFKKNTSCAKIKRVNSNNIYDVLDFQDEKYVDIFKTFLNMGDIGYYAYINERCIHRSWVKTNRQIVYPHWASSYKLKNNEIFIHYCETDKKARGLGVYPHVLSQIAQEYSKNDILISINAKNISSQKGAQKVGFKERERERVIVLFGIKIIKKITQQKL